jgi:hypothetical protein
LRNGKKGWEKMREREGESKIMLVAFLDDGCRFSVDEGKK